ncbi:type II toxin-antitoxin system HicA family toxin [Sporosarcina sp. FSL K6-1540]|uniref:type II toxin-antitoxin system HicA family toxin n=1 Tax=Sporosarcina sp. FSL K6-1540 TaxID=2921555 RepID=UPI00315A2F49
MKSREIIKILEADGWVWKRTNGSHYIYKHPQKTGTVPVPHPKDDIPIGTERNIFKLACLLK